MVLGVGVGVAKSKANEPAFDPTTTANFWIWFQDPVNLTIAGTAAAPTLLTQTNKLGGSFARSTENNTAKVPKANRTFGGKNVVDYDGNSYMYVSVADTDIANTANWTSILLVKGDTTTNNMCIFVGMQGGSNNFGLLTRNFGTAGYTFRQANTGIDLVCPLDTNPHIIVTRRNGTLLEMWVDGVYYGSANSSVNMSIANGYFYGQDAGAGGRDYFDGVMPDHRIFKASLTNSEINKHAKDIIKAFPGEGITWTNI